MNKHCYRIVFNQTRGMPMVVAESARSQGGAGEPDGAGGLRASPPARRAAFALSTLSLGVLLITGGMSWSPSAGAQIVADRSAPGARQATVLNTANGVLQVNIQTPSAAGVSHNVYSQFDVPARGAVLNNARSAATTRLGGLVQGNPWLAGGTARVILNEVNATSPSQLRGYIEVGGDRAEVVIANPAGIVCDGCGFINASRSTLTTGAPLLTNGSLDGFRVQGGRIEVQGAGLDAADSDYTGLIARAVDLNAGIWAKDLRVITGAAEVSADAASATALAASGPAPAFALDVALLGGMYANRITLVGAEAGLGMRSAGHIGAAAGEVLVTLDGRLENSGRLTATGAIGVAAAGGIANSGSLYALGDTTLATPADVTSSGLVAAGGNVELSAARIAGSSASAFVAGLHEDGSLGAGWLQADASGALAANGQNLAQSGIRFAADSLSLAGSQTATRQLDLLARRGDIDASAARIGVDESLQARSTGTLRSDAAHVSAARLQISAENLSNRAGSLVQTGPTALAVTLPGSLDNQGGYIASAGTAFDLAATTVANADGRIEHTGSGTFALSVTTLDGPRGSLASAGTLRLGAATLILDGGNTRADSLQIDSARLSSVGGQITQSGNGPMQVRATQLLDNSGGRLASNGSLGVDAGELRNTAGSIQAGADASLRMAGAADNSGGSIVAGRQLKLGAASLDNSRGLVSSAAGSLGLTLSGALANPLGDILAGADLSLTAASLASSGTLYSQRHLRIDIAEALASTGVIAAAGDASLSAGRIDSSTGSLLAAGMQADGSAAAAGSLSVLARDGLLAQGRNQAVGAFVASGRNVDLAGSQSRAENISLAALAGDVVTRDAIVAGSATLEIRTAADPARQLDNRGGQLSAAQLDLSVANLDNRAGSLQQSGSGDLTLATASLDNRGGRIATNSRQLTLSADGLDNAQGLIVHAGSDSLVITATTLAGGQGRILTNGSLNLAAGEIDLDGAETRAHHIRINSPLLSHQGALLAGSGTLDIKADTLLDNTGGLITANGDTTVQAGTLLNRQGTLQATGNASLTLAASGVVDNSAGSLSTQSGHLVVESGGALLNRLGAIGSGGAFDARLASLDNSGTLYAADRLAIVSAGLIDNTGVLAGRSSVQLDAARLSAGAASLLAAGLQSDGSFGATGDLTVTTADLLAAHGHNQAAGRLVFSGRDVDLSGATTRGSRVMLTATGGDLVTAGGSVATPGELLIEARSGTASRLDNRAGHLAAGHLDIQVANLDNRAGAIEQSGTTATVLALTAPGGLMDNRGGFIAGNGLDFALAAHTLLNSDGRIAHAGSGTLNLSAASLDNQRGVVLGNGSIRVLADLLNNDTGSFNARSLDLHAASLLNRGGEIVHSGPTAGAIAVAGLFDNRAGRLASAGDFSLAAGVLDNRGGTLASAGTASLGIHVAGVTDNSSAGKILAGGSARLETAAFDNTDGQLAASESLGVVAANGLANLRGTLAAGQALSVTAATLDNTEGSLQSLHAALAIDVAGEFANRRGQALAGSDLRAVVGSLDNSGTLYAGGSAFVAARGDALNTGLVAAGSNLVLAGAGIASDATSVLAAGLQADGSLAAGGDLTVSASGPLMATGHNLAGGRLAFSGTSVDLTASRTEAGHIAILATGGDILTIDSRLSTPGQLSLNASGADNRGGELLAGQLQIQAVTLDNRDGRIAQSGSGPAGITATQLFDNRLGSLVGNGDTTLVVGQLLNSEGHIQTAASAALGIHAGGHVDNLSGALVAGGRLTLQAASLDNRAGQISAIAGGLGVNLESGRLDNAGGRLEAAETLSLAARGIVNAAGSITGRQIHVDSAGQAFDNRGGLLAAREGLSLASGELDNAAGTLQAGGELLVDTGGQRLANTASGSTAGIFGRGRVDLRSGILDNSGGFIGATANLAIAASTLLNRDGAAISTEQSLVVAASVVDNRGGQIQALGDLAIDTGAGRIDNTGSLIRAAGQASLTAGQLVNAATPDGSGLGIEGRSLRIQTTDLDNRHGALRANDNLAVLASGSVDNSGGLMSAGHTLRLADNSPGAAAGSRTLSILNTGGTLIAGRLLDIDAARLGGDGSLLSRGDITVRLTGDYNHSGVFRAAGNASLVTAGNIVNHAAMEAGQTLHLSAAHITNLTDATLSGDTTELNAAVSLLNRGLIDGRETRISTAELLNAGRGRIYGDHLAIQAGTLVNEQQYGNSATIAARERLDLGVHNLVNREHALIFSAGDMAIGGTLDAAGRATGMAARIDNSSATIEALGQLSLASAQLANTNAHFSTRIASVGSPEEIIYITPSGASGMFPVAMFNWGHWSKAGAYYWAVDKLMPEFGVLGESPVPRVGEVGCADDFPGDECQSIYELAISSSYPRNDKAWAYFHLTPPDPQPVTPTIAKPAEPMLIKPVAPDLARAASCQPGAGYSDTACSAYTIELDTYTQQLASDSAALAAYSASMGAYEAAWSAYRDTEAAWAAATEIRYTALDEAIVKYNEAIDGGRIKSWTQYEVTRTHSQSEVVSSDPAQILAGGAMRITGLDLLNDKSRILAGGLLSGDLGSLRNVDGEGVYITHEAGTSQTTWTKYKGDRKGYSVRRWSAPTPYLPADKVTTITLPVAETRGDTAPSGSGASIAGRSTSTLDTPVESTGTATAGTRAAAIIEVRANLAAPVAGSTGSAPVAAPQTAGSIATAEAAGAAPVALVAAPAVGASGLAGIKTAALPVAAAPALVPVDAAPAGVTPALQGSPTAARPQAVGAAPAVVIRSVAPDTRLPSSSLFTVNPAGDARYLVETDPRFTDRRQWLSSDYMLGALSVDPATVQKRLGDGFYEQRLVREQVAQLTGRRFLDGYADDEAQYLALLDNAATYARAWNLLPGLALSAEQMAGLTSDIVWLVDEAVTLPDGRLTHALVPRLYVRVREGDLDGNGSLISADALDIALSGDLQNNATLAGRSVVSLSAENVKNLGGRIRGTDVGIKAGQDLSIEGGRIEATDRLAVLAGRDLNIATTTRSTATAQGNYTGIDRIAGLYITGSTAAGELIAAAGRDLGLTAATVENAGQGSTVLSAGRDLNLATVTTTRRQETVWDASNYRKDANSLEIGTTLDVAGKLLLQSGHDLTARAATLKSRGDLTLQAGNDLRLEAGRASTAFDEAQRTTDDDLFARKTSVTRNAVSRQTLVSSTLDAANIDLAAGRDIRTEAAQLVARQGLGLDAGRDLHIGAATESVTETHLNQTLRQAKGLGKFAGALLLPSAGVPGVSFAADLMGSQRLSQEGWQSSSQAVGSTVSAATIQARSGRDAVVQGSTLVADGDIRIETGRDLQVVAVSGSRESTSKSSAAKSGSVGKTWQPAIGRATSSSNLAEAASTLTASQVASLAGNVDMRVGQAYTQRASDILALGVQPDSVNIAIRAAEVVLDSAATTRDSTYHAEARRVALGGSVSVPIVNAIQGVTATVEAAGQTRDSRSHALAAATLALQSYAVVGAVTNPTGVKVGVSLGSSSNTSDTVQHSTDTVGSKIAATGNIVLEASGKGDTSRIQATGARIEAGRDLDLKADGGISLEAAHSSYNQSSTNSSSGASIGVAYSSGGSQNGFTLELSANKSQGKGDGQDLQHTQTRLVAGETARLKVGGDTTLRGASITGKQLQTDIGGQLTIESVQDFSSFHSKQDSAGFGLSLCIPPLCGGISTASINAAQNRIASNFLSVTEQSGLFAGDGGFQLQVKGNTDLAGAVIASSDKAAAEGRNRLTTAGINTRDLHNAAAYDAQGFSVGITLSSAGAPKSEGNTASTESPRTPGARPGEQSRATPGASVGYGAASGSSASLTRSAISTANIQLTGQEPTALASLNRDTEREVGPLDSEGRSTRTVSALKPIFDQNAVSKDVAAQVAISKEASYLLPKAVGDYANTQTRDYEIAVAARDASRKNLQTETDPARQAELQTTIASAERLIADRQDTYDNWKEGGAYRVALHTVVGGLLSGNAAGLAGAGATAAAAPRIDALTQDLPEPVSQAAGMVLGSVIGAVAGSATGGGLPATASGAAAGLVVDANNRQLHVSETEKLKQKADEQARASLAGRNATETETALAKKYWFDLLSSEALAVVDVTANRARTDYLGQVEATRQPGLAGQAQAERYLQDAATARQIVASMSGALLIGTDGKPIVADGAAVRAFQSTDKQFADSQLFLARDAATLSRQFGSSQAASGAFARESSLENRLAASGRLAREDAQLSSLRVPSEGVTRVYPELDLSPAFGPVRQVGKVLLRGADQVLEGAFRSARDVLLNRPPAEVVGMENIAASEVRGARRIGENSEVDIAVAIKSRVLSNIDASKAARQSSNFFEFSSTERLVKEALASNQSPWPLGYYPVSRPMSIGEEFNMVIDANQAVGLSGPGGFGTFSSIPDQGFARSVLAITEQFKRDVSFSQRYEVAKKFNALEGPIGPQIDQVSGRLLRGSQSIWQLDLQLPWNQRTQYLRPIGDPIPLKP